MKYVLIILLAVLAAGCVSNDGAFAAKINDTVSVRYTGTLDDGTQFDSNVGRESLEFTLGSGRVIKGFEAAIIGMKAGEEKTVKILAADAYGPYNESLIMPVLKTRVPDGVKVNDTLYSGGRPVKVVAVGNDSVAMDFNHPLAGKDLTFRIKLEEIRKN